MWSCYCWHSQVLCNQICFAVNTQNCCTIRSSYCWSVVQSDLPCCCWHTNSCTIRSTLLLTHTQLLYSQISCTVDAQTTVVQSDALCCWHTNSCTVRSAVLLTHKQLLYNRIHFAVDNHNSNTIRRTFCDVCKHFLVLGKREDINPWRSHFTVQQQRPETVSSD